MPPIIIYLLVFLFGATTAYLKGTIQKTSELKSKIMILNTTLVFCIVYIGLYIGEKKFGEFPHLLKMTAMFLSGALMDTISELLSNTEERIESERIGLDTLPLLRNSGKQKKENDDKS